MSSYKKYVPRVFGDEWTDPKKISEMNKIRRFYKLDELNLVTRNCLKCEKEFNTYSKINRLCSQCGGRYVGPYDPF